MTEKGERYRIRSARAIAVSITANAPRPVHKVMSQDPEDVFNIRVFAKRWREIAGVSLSEAWVERAVKKIEMPSITYDPMKVSRFFHWIPPSVDTPPVTQREIITPGAGGVEIPVDKTKYRIKFIGETEDRVDVVIEPKE